MFTKKIVESDSFAEMPLSAQALYFHLNMGADDDGFVNSPNKIRRSIGAAEDDLRLLAAKKFILDFGNGVIVIKHWRMNNQIRKDRYKPTQYAKEMSLLTVREDGAYTLNTDEKASDNHLATTWQPNGNQVATQYSIGEYSLVEGSIKDKIDILDKSAFAPFEPNILTKELIEAGYIEDTDLCIDQYNDILQNLIENYSFEIARSCVWYFVKRYKEKPTDENGNEIENKVAYFRTSVCDGAKKLEKSNSQEYSGVGSWLFHN